MTRHIKQLLGMILIWVGLILIACGMHESNLEVKQIGLMIFMIGSYFSMMYLIQCLK